MVSILLSRVLGLARDVIAGIRFGQTEMTDAYTVAFRIPDIIFYLVAGGALSSAFIPVFSEYLAKKQEDEAWKVFSIVATVMTLAVSLLVALGMVFAPQLSALIAWGKPPSVHDEIAYMGRILLPAQICFFLGSLMFATLYSRNNYTIPGVGGNLYNIGIIAGAVVISAFVTPDVSGMAWGALIGAFLGNVVVPSIVLARAGVKYRPSFQVKHPGVVKVFRLMLPVVLGLSLPSVFAFILQSFATKFPTGYNTAFDYANKLQQAPLAVFGMSMALAVFPTLSKQWAQGDLASFREQAVSTVNTTIYMALPAAALLMFVPGEILRVVFEHGNFLASDTARTAPLVQAFAVGLLAWCLQPTLMRTYYATQETVQPVLIGTAATAIFFVVCFVVNAANAAPVVLAYSGSLAGFVLAGLLLWGIGRRVQGLELGRIGSAFWKALAASAVMGLLMKGAVIGWEGAGSPLGSGGLALVLVIAFTASAWVYYGITKALGMKETAYIERAVAKMNRRGKAGDSGTPAGG